MKNRFLFVFIFCLSFISFSQEMVFAHKNLIKTKPTTLTEESETGLYSATKFIIENPNLGGSREYRSSVQIVEYWINKETWLEIPIESSFYNSFKENQNLVFMNTVASINYILNQKIEHQRILKCKSIKKANNYKQKECKEIQLNAAKILLKYCIDNKVSVSTDMQKYMDMYINGTLEKMFFNKLRVDAN